MSSAPKPLPRRRSKRRIRPLRQGDLDGLCGVYAIVNAIRYLCPRLSRHDAEALFKVIVRAHQAKATGRPLAFVHGGLTRRALLPLVQATVAHVEQAHGKKLTVASLPATSGTGNGRGQADLVWRQLQRCISSDCLAIAGLMRDSGHWTVIIDITPHQMRLFDSDGIGIVRRSWFDGRGRGTPHALDTADVILLQRRNGRCLEV